MLESNKDPIKEAFAKAKQDIFNLSSQIEFLKREIQSLKEIIRSSIKPRSDRQSDNSAHSSTDNPTLNQKPAQNTQNQTIQHINQTETDTTTHNPAQNHALYGLKTQFPYFSTGNRGVPADRQTDQQTHNKHPTEELNEPLPHQTPLKIQHIDSHTTQQSSHKSLEEVSTVLESLDTIKKELRQKFKRLTKQEMIIFSAIYQLEEEGFTVDYTLLSQKINLTESSIRDYIQRLVKKGIPLIKNKENNKRILLSISPELKKIASLSTIIKLREL